MKRNSLHYCVLPKCKNFSEKGTWRGAKLKMAMETPLNLNVYIKQNTVRNLMQNNHKLFKLGKDADRYT